MAAVTRIIGASRKAISGFWQSQAEKGSTYPKGDVGAQEAAGNSSIASSHDNVNFRERHICQVGPDQQRRFGLQTSQMADNELRWLGAVLATFALGAVVTVFDAGSQRRKQKRGLLFC